MNDSLNVETPHAAVLAGKTAGDLMTPNPVSIEDTATVEEAIALLTDKGFSAAPVIDEAGHPVGVLTQSDILLHDREEVEYVAPPEFEHGTPLPRSMWADFQVERVDTTPVRDLMTPAVLCVAEETAAWTALQQMRERNVHRLFVVDQDGVLVGVVTTMDVVRHLTLAE